MPSRFLCLVWMTRNNHGPGEEYHRSTRPVISHAARATAWSNTRTARVVGGPFIVYNITKIGIVLHDSFRSFVTKIGKYHDTLVYRIMQ